MPKDMSYKGYGSSSGKAANPQGSSMSKGMNVSFGTGNSGRKYPAGYDKRGPAPKKMGASHDAPNQRKD